MTGGAAPNAASVASTETAKPTVLRSEGIILLVAVAAALCFAALISWGVGERRYARTEALWTEAERDHRLFVALASNFLSNAALGLHAAAVELNHFDGEDLDRYDEVPRTLHRRLGLLPWAEELEVLDTAGAVRAAALSERLDGGLRRIPDALARIKRGEALFVSFDGPSLDANLKRPAIRLSTPLRGRDGAVIGLVSASLSLGRLIEELFPGMGGARSKQILRRQDGQIVAVAGGREGERLTDYFPEAAAWPLPTERDGALRHETDGALVIDGPLENWPLALTIARNRAPLDVAQRQDASFALALGALALALLTPATWMALRWTRRQAQAMAALAQARGDAERLERGRALFFAAAGHELRSPLNAILGFSELYRAEVFGPLGAPEYVDYAESIHISAQRLVELVDELLEYARAESGALKIRPQQNDLLDVVAECYTVVESLALKNDVTLSLPDIESNLNVYADSSALRKMLLNLLTNAVKATPEGGRVSLCARRLAQGVRVTVSDTGVGMTPEQAAAALQPFRQMDVDHNQRHKGFGLGLPLVKMLIEAHGGALTIESSPGAGARISLLFQNTPAA